MTYDLWKGLREWPWDEKEIPRPLREIPPSEISSRDAVAFKVPKTAVKLARAAVANGWGAHITGGRGPRLHSTLGTVTKVVDSVAVRMRRPPQYAVGFWEDGKFIQSWAWETGEGLVAAKSPEINEHIKHRNEDELT